MFQVLRHGDLRRLFLGTIISLGGDWFAMVAILGVISDATDKNGLALALVPVATALPSGLVTPWAGSFADRFDRRKVMVIASLIQAVAALGFLLVDADSLWLAYAVLVVISAVGAFFIPASSAAVPNLVPTDELRPAMTLMSSSWGLMLALGSAAGGLVASVFGRDAAFVANSVSFVLVALLIWRISTPTQQVGEAERPRLRPVKDTADGIRYARRDPILLAMLASKTGFAISGGIAGVLPLLATRSFNSGDGGIGLVMAARGAGVVLGSASAIRFGKTPSSLLRTCGLSFVTYGIGYSVASFSPNLAVAFVLLVLAHLGGGLQWTLSTLGLQQRLNDEFRGRVLAADFALVTSMLSISFLVYGALGEWLGPRPVMAIVGCLAIASGTTYVFATQRLMRRTETVEAGLG
jgi:MFS family permease